MIYFECSRCGTVIKLTDKEVNLLLAHGILYLDCLQCGKEIALDGRL